MSLDYVDKVAGRIGQDEVALAECPVEQRQHTDIGYSSAVLGP
jgi:hypothetical protein